MSRRNIITLILLAFLVFFMICTAGAKEYWKSTPQAEKEESTRGWLGVYLQDITTEIRESMDLMSKEGVLVRDVVNESPADQAGIQQEDVIIEFDRKKVSDASDLTEMVRATSPDQEVELRLIRDGSEKTLTVTIGKSPGKELAYEYKFESPHSKTLRIRPDMQVFRFFSGSKIGVKVEDLSEQLGNYFGVEDGEGALITEVDEDMPAFKAGLKAGDVIVEADGKKIKDTEDLMGAVSEKEKGDKVEIKVVRNRQPQSFSVEVKEGKEKRSSFGPREFDKVIKFKGDLTPPEMFLEKEFSSDIQEQLQDLKDELQDLKEQLDDLREKIR